MTQDVDPELLKAICDGCDQCKRDGDYEKECCILGNVRRYFNRANYDTSGIKVTTTLAPATFKFVADMARTNGVDVPSLVSAIVEERVRGTQRAYAHKEAEGANP